MKISRTGSKAVFAIPGDLRTPSGGYVYDRRVLELLPSWGVNAGHVALPASFPAPTARDLAETDRLLRNAAAGCVLLIDGLAYGVMPADLIRRLGRPIVALVHHPLCLETGHSPERCAELRDSEMAALSLARHVIVPSATTAGILRSDFTVADKRITVAEPGTDPAPRATGSSGPVQILAAGSIIPRKGYDVLVRALDKLPPSEWALTIAGATDRSPETTSALVAQVRRSKCSSNIRLVGALDRQALAELYSRADLFVMSSLYEGYGMVLTEALARGLAIVTTTFAAAAERVPDAAALKVPPGDVDALANALQRAIEDAALRKRLADASWAAARALPQWEDTARTIAGVLKNVVP
jgi:glycosyltransferase involved in cell wall biosynthesis